MSKKHIQQNVETTIKPVRLSDIWVSLRVAAVTVLIYLSFVASMLPLTGYNLYGFYRFPKSVDDPKPVAQQWKNYAHPGAGYDGQFYFRLALDPFTQQRNAHGINPYGSEIDEIKARIDNVLRNKERISKKLKAEIARSRQRMLRAFDASLKGI